MDEEVDYMSDKFLKDCSSDKYDVCPGLLKTHREKRQHIIMKKIRNEKKEIKEKKGEKFKEILEEGLSQPLNSSNKGFSLLQKMGFKTGMGLGKNNEGILEPIPITLKSNKEGLGLETKKRKIKSSENKNTKKLDSVSEEDFRAFLSNKFKEKELLKDFQKAQRICLELDLQKNISKPNEIWFWPINAFQDKESKDIDDSSNEEEFESELSKEDKLEILVKYLRYTYFYCIWCEIKYEDEKEMESCPGIEKNSHSNI